MPMPLAHAGHWIESILYIIPLVVLVGFVVTAKLKDRAAERRELAAGASVSAPGARDERPSSA